MTEYAFPLTNELSLLEINKAQSIAEKSYEGFSQGDILRSILSRTCDDWRALELNVPINSHSFPKKKDKLMEVERLHRETKSLMTRVLAKIEKELESCLQKTARQRTS